MHSNKVHATHFSQDAHKTAAWHKRCKGGTLPERKRLAWLLAARKVNPFHWFKTASAPCPLIVLYIYVYIYMVASSWWLHHVTSIFLLGEKYINKFQASPQLLLLWVALQRLLPKGSFELCIHRRRAAHLLITQLLGTCRETPCRRGVSI